jgi:hypothetical protein
MSGPGDVDGEVSGDEAAWRDLVARLESPTARAADAAPWPAREDLPADEMPEPAPPPEPPAPAGPATPADVPVVGSTASFEHSRVIRFAGDPRSYKPPEETGEPFKPEPLPPPARMDPVAKGAWVALIGGPGYLLLGTVLQWTISGTEALAAIAAFIAGFVILVVKMGDRPPRDEDDDGAVV